MDLPIEFIARTKELLGEEAFAHFERELASVSPTSIRLNPFKYNSQPDIKSVKWCRNGYYLTKRMPFTFDPLFHAGVYYVQEASSMFLDMVLKEYINSPIVALDLCAAPGGKSTLIRSSLPEGSLLFANEYVRNRSQILAENLIKWGNSDVIVTNNAPADYTPFKSLFDFILTDVPCSGEGMFRKDETAIDEWSVENVINCQRRQREIVEDIWPTLKSGGIMVYSTCTYNHEENEDNVKWIAETLGADIITVPTMSEWNITGSLTDTNLNVYRFLPHKTTGEGLFMAILRKHSDATTCDDDYYNQSYKKGVKKKSTKKESTLSTPAEIKDWISDKDNFIFNNDGVSIDAFSKEHYPIYELVKDKLRIIHKGIQVATIKGRDAIPSHSLAMSTHINQDSFCCIELDYTNAIAYLRKEAIIIDSSYPRGYVLFTYRNMPIGFAKNIGNRTNNLYPQEWRIRSGYPPEEDPAIL